MKTVTKYISDDGVEFLTKEECLSHEEKVEKVITAMMMHDDPALKLVILVSQIYTVLGIDVPSREGYIDLFHSHKPCAYYCTLWRFFADYKNQYPTLFNLFSDALEEYVEMYGEFAQHD